MELDARLQFVDSLELSESSGAYVDLALDLLDYPRAGFVDAGSAVSFVAGVSPMSQQDTLMSTLLAQLAANQKFDRENDTVGWYNFYKTVLENVGWVLQSFDFTKYRASGASFTMDKVVLDLIAAIASGDEVAALQSTLDAMKSLSSSDGKIVLFESSSHSASHGNFQIAVANETGGALSMRIAGSHFSTKQNVTRVLFFGFSSSETDLYTGSQTMTLNKVIYQQVRQQVIQKLGDKAKRFVRDLDIG